MIVQFKAVSSKKLLKELNIDIIPQVGSVVKIGPRKYSVMLIEFDTNNIAYTIWLRNTY